MAMRICSLQSSATEIVYALGLGSQLVAVTDRCDYPPEASKKPIASRGIFSGDLSSGEIDRAVNECVQSGRSTHILDKEVLRAARPDLVITQDLCHVCAVGSGEVIQAFHTLELKPQFVVLAPATLWDVLDNIQRVGQTVGVGDHAEKVVAQLQHRIREVAEGTMLVNKRPRVFCMEWIDPPMAGGHWMSEMIWLAGGVDILGRHGLTSVQPTWEGIAACQPEVIIIQPCGLDIPRTLREVQSLVKRDGWHKLPAVQDNQVYAVDPVYFTRPGPRLVTGTEILAQILHPETFHGLIPHGAVMQLGLGKGEPSAKEYPG
ncbi:MAG: cobalamin-binding protein [Chloroflexi bacterium]|nr:cobalamin-binding protein [Chloroflexota bacterium]